MKMLMRFGQLAPMALAGFLCATLPHAAGATERPLSADRTIVAIPAATASPVYYYYHGRRYPYRYHGVYFSHRYYGGGRYHYY